LVTEPSSQTVGRRYVLHERLGIGGMGVVYRATDRLSGQQVALKRVTIPVGQLEFASQDHGVDPNLALAQEFKALASLRHPHIIHVLDYGFDREHQPFFTMDLLQDAQTIVAAGQGQALITQVGLLVQACQALVYLHRRNVLHRDLKPENVLVVDGQVRLLDFGLSVITSRSMEHLTQTTAGTMAYLAPELFQGAPVTQAADLYAVGVMVYEMLAGRHPFDTSNAAVLLNDILCSPADVRSIGLGDELTAVLERLLAKTREERYNDPGDVIRDLCAATGCPAPAETVEIRESFLQAAQFVGRERELEQLSGALDAALAGHGSAWLVGGESGIGKTRLVDELRVLALVKGASVLRGQAIREGGRPFHLWRDVLRGLALTTDLTVREASVFKSLVPQIAEWVGREVPDAPALDPKATLTRWTWTASQVLDRQERPLVVIVEDLQWAGSESLAMLDRLAQRMGSRCILLVGTYRDEERPELPEELPEMRVLRLERLHEQEVAELSVSMLGPAGQREPVLELLCRETDGNPFYLVEVVRALAEEAGQLEAVGAMRLPFVVVGAGAPQIVQRRLDFVPAEARPLLELAAVAGSELDLDQLRALAPETDLERWLTACADVAVLAMDAGRWRFAHDKLREGVLETLADATGLHRRVAQNLEQSFPERAESQAALLAYHYARAENWEKAQEFLFKAGDQAGRVAADAEALAHYQDAMAAYTRAYGDRWEPVQRAALERKMGEALFRRGEHRQALDHLQRSLACLDRPLPTSRWSVRLAILGEIGRQVGHRLLPRLFLGPMGRAASPEAEEEARAYETIGWIDVFTNLERFLLVNLRELNVAERGGFVPGVGSGAQGVGSILDFASLFGLAEVYHRRALALAQQTQDSGALGLAHMGLAVHNWFLGEWNAVLEHCRQADSIYREMGDLHSWGSTLTLLTGASSVQGDLCQALTHSRNCVRLGQEGADPQVLCWGLYAQGQAHYCLGHLSDAVSVLQEAVRLARSIPDHLYYAAAGGLLGRCYLRQGDIEQALSTLEATHEAYLKNGSIAALTKDLCSGLAEAYLLAAEQSKRADRADWPEKAKHACRIALKQGKAYRGALPEAMTLQGRYEWLRNRLSAARRWWQRGLALAEELGQPYDEGIVHLEMGKRLGDRAHLERAEVIFSEVGAQWDLARAREALAQTPPAG
jgi:tetratricopeptide (TPR) repeat protein